MPSDLLGKHDLFRKPVSTFRDHASGETPGAERRDVHARRLIADYFCHNLSGHRRGRHADMTVSERINDIARAARAADHRQRVPACSDGAPSTSRDVLRDSSL